MCTAVHFVLRSSGGSSHLALCYTRAHVRMWLIAVSGFSFLFLVFFSLLSHFLACAIHVRAGNEKTALGCS
ncbi:hypothetical protein BS47DRAFT_516797 [Hydnum rufescens UP504]|uniref:Uncharacterized protein n=1 Tax=Hydnum rufescens UP504 TaxID=1448309 RepID=A0A9P6AH21_9AGAM|nr:hypothetical protein BS47DRAFT_516797 [Hydnum rufescens UP504]